MASINRITDFADASSIDGDEDVLVSQKSATVTITAVTISALASDNSYNDSGAGFVAAGFAVGNRVCVEGFTGNVANNIAVGVVTALTAGKMTIGGTDGDVIVDDAAGESVTISKWTSAKASLSVIFAAFLGTAGALDVDTDGTFAANSDAVVPSQKAAKTYITAAIAAAVVGLWDNKGSIDCSANPNYPAALKGDTYLVSVAGKIGGGSGPTVEAGDVIVCHVDNAGGTHASVGASWVIVQNNLVGAYVAGGTDVALADGGTGSSTAAGARTNLGLNTRSLIVSLQGTPLTASEVLAAIMPPTGETWTFAANLSTSSGKKVSGGVNPASTYTIDLKKNGTSVATLSISTSGVVSFTTSGGTTFSLTGGTDELQLVGHATPDIAVGYVINLVYTW